MTTTTTPALDREAWLTEAAHLIYDDLIATHIPRPTDRQFRISVGFPAGTRANNKALAVCWASAASADGTNEIFVTPALADSVEILASVAHELIHYADDLQSGHRGAFATTARAIGLEGKMTATTASPNLRAQLQSYVDLLGPIPHAALDATKSGKGKQSTRMIKVSCDCCEFAFRASQKHIDLLDPTATCPACLVGSLTPEIKD